MPEGAANSFGASKPGDIAATLKQVLDKLSPTIKKSADSSNLLRKTLAQLETAQNATSKSTRKQAENTRNLANVSEKASKLIGKMADDYAGGFETMSDAQKKVFDRMLEDVKSAERAAGSIPGSSRDQLILSEKARQMQVEGARDILQQTVLRGKMLQSEGGLINRLSGGMTSLLAKGAMWKADIAEGIGSAIGLDSAAIVGLGAAAGVVAGVFLALDMAMKNAAKSMGDAAKASFQLGDGVARQQQTSSEFQTALFKATSWVGGFGKDQIIEFADAMGGEMGTALGGGIEQSVMFAKNIAAVGLTFGVAGDEAVKMGTRLGVASRTDLRGASRLFMILGEEAQALNVNMEHLATPMLLMAELAGRAGAGADSAAMAMDAMVGAAEGLSSVGGPLSRVFGAITNAEKTNMVGKFADQFAKISDIQWMAFSMKPGEGAQHAFERVENAGPVERMGYISELKKRINFNQMVATKGEGLDFARQALGSILSGGSMSPFSHEALMAGTMADLMGTKGHPAESREKVLGSAIEANFNQRASLGEYIAGGGDVMQWIANDIGKILMLLNKWDSSKLASIFVGGGAGAMPEASKSVAYRDMALSRQHKLLQGPKMAGA
jgi:hypothetical protein